MIDIDRAALLVIDVQNGFVNEFSAHVVPVIADLATRWAHRPASGLHPLLELHR